MASKKENGQLNIISSMEQKIDEAEVFFDNLATTSTYLVENTNNLLLQIESYQIPKTEGELHSFAISTDFKKCIASIVQQYDFYNNYIQYNTVDLHNTKEFHEYRDVLTRLAQALKMLSRKLAAIRKNFTELLEEADDLRDNFLLEGSGNDCSENSM